MVATEQKIDVSTTISQLDQQTKTEVLRKIVTMCQFMPQAFLTDRITQVKPQKLSVDQLRIFGGELSEMYAEYSQGDKSPESQDRFLEDAILALDHLYLMTVEHIYDANTLLTHWQKIADTLLQGHMVTIKTDPQLVIDTLESQLSRTSNNESKIE